MLTMRNKMMLMALTLFLTGLAGRAAFAATPQGASAQIGLALPLVGDLKDLADPGIFLGAQAMHQADVYNRYGIGMSYMSFGKASEQNVDTEVSIISTLALVHHDLAGGKGGTPFFEGGFGFARTQVNIAASNATGPDVTKGTNQEDISPTVLLGFGFDLPVSNGATFGLSVDYQHFFFKVGQVSGGGSLSVLANLRV
jgi:hypothetical protein